MFLNKKNTLEINILPQETHASPTTDISFQFRDHRACN